MKNKKNTYIITKKDLIDSLLLISEVTKLLAKEIILAKSIIGYGGENNVRTTKVAQ